MLSKNPKKRIKLEDIIKSKWINQGLTPLRFVIRDQEINLSPISPLEQNYKLFQEPQCENNSNQASVQDYNKLEQDHLPA